MGSLKRCVWIAGLILLTLTAGCGTNPDGSPGTDTGESGLTITSFGNLGDRGYNTGFSVDTVQVGGEKYATHLVTFSATITDYYDQYTTASQGVTFTRYTVTYSSDVTGAPALAGRTIYQTISASLDGGHSAVINQEIELVGLETKQEFADAITASPASEDPVSYTATLTFYGTDWVTESDIETSFTVNLEFSNFDNSEF
jgi:hypothetical protein